MMAARQTAPLLNAQDAILSHHICAAQVLQNGV
ncbi:hypothetical protein J2Z17_001584 [Rhizobium halophytocola]|uniref:Uncharacterized protein n=1 Tax=Rhizobium halophytocola TaxID=735519 RepID=A0ABS4DWU6_9HYPH|nr:hypothetical protein [Rhizobium halophytocola]